MTTTTSTSTTSTSTTTTTTTTPHTEIFYGDAHDSYIFVLGKKIDLHPKYLDAMIEYWDLDERGRPVKDPQTGKIKTKTVSKFIQSIHIWSKGIKALHLAHKESSKFYRKCDLCRKEDTVTVIVPRDECQIRIGINCFRKLYGQP